MTTTHSRHNSLAATIETEADIRRGMRSLRRRCALLRTLHDAVGDPPVRRQPAGFEGMARTVVAQQVSAASAAAIWTRLARVVEPMTAERFLAAEKDDVRAAGLSSGKHDTLCGLARAVQGGALDLEALARQDDEAVRRILTGHRGVGPWTADIYLMFCLGRADAWSSRDLALALAVQKASGQSHRPTPAALEAMAERWRPWRAVAARLLWHFYAAQER